MAEYKVWECLACGIIYDEAKGWPEEGIAPQTRWEDVPEDWRCPDCGVDKSDFEMAGVSKLSAAIAQQTGAAHAATEVSGSSQAPVVIVGTGLAGYQLAKEFRKHDTNTPLVMITADDGSYYSKPMLSTACAKNKLPEDLVTASAQGTAAELGIEILTFTQVTQIDVDAHQLKLGDDTIAYSKLVLASGGSCIQPPMAGDGVGQVFNINNLNDYRAFRQTLEGSKRVIIIGAGLIGTEYANDLILSGFDVTVVEPMAGPLASLLPAQASGAIRSALEQAGVEYHLGTVVKRVDKIGKDDGVRVTLANGTVLEGDVVLSAVGLAPRVELAESAGIAIERGIVTNRLLETSEPDIYAIGDCAQVDGHLLFYIAPLLACARALGQTLAGTPTEVHYGGMPVAVKTTLCPVVVAVPSRDAEGGWVIDNEDQNSVCARFLSPDGLLLGFVLTGEFVRKKDSLSPELMPLMSEA